MSVFWLFFRLLGNRKEKKKMKTAVALLVLAIAAIAFAAKSENCGQAYNKGTALGPKQCVRVQGKLVVIETANAFAVMEKAANAAGITLKVNSGFRTMAEQQHLYGCYQSKACNNGNLAAKPGYSNHQSGKALDIAVAQPAVFTWMRNNASKFGFVRTVASENWHWEHRPNTACNSIVSYTCK
jgi:LAS superfamily LD-carboxypeptidase LdcB